MSVIIKGMEMPPTCYQCPFCDYEQSNCMAADERHTDATRYDKRMTWCPLEPVVHGHWIEVEEPCGWNTLRCASCTACGESFVLNEDLGIEDIKEWGNFCPNCGADMREVDDV